MAVNVSDWSATPASNTTVDGVNIAENCSPASVNNAIRSVMAGVRSFYDRYVTLDSSVSGKVNADAGQFRGTQPVWTGEGAFLHNRNSAHSSGKVDLLPEGSPRPTSVNNGDIVFYYR